MPSVSVDRIVDFPPDKIWSVLSDFGGFRDWALGGQGTIDIEGHGPGMIRFLDVPGMGKIAERLEKADNAAHHLVYSLHQGNPLGMARYTANVRLSSAGDGKCEIHWNGEFDAVEDAIPADVATNLEGSYHGMTDALVAFLSAN